jgi:hypothetical protein
MTNQVLVLFQKSGGGFVQAVLTSLATRRSLEHAFTASEMIVQETQMVMEPTHHQQPAEVR